MRAVLADVCMRLFGSSRLEIYVAPMSSGSRVGAQGFKVHQHDSIRLSAQGVVMIFGTRGILVHLNSGERA